MSLEPVQLASRSRPRGRGQNTKNVTACRISRSDRLLLTQFQRWHEMLISVAEPNSSERSQCPGIGC